MYTGDIEILELIPQRPPFLLVDRLTDFEPERSMTSFVVKENGVLVRDGRLSEAGVMENIAQSCAARIGYINKYKKNETVKLGIIGAIRDFTVTELPSVGDTLVTEIVVISEVFDITLVKAEVKVGDAVIAGCQMKISLTDIEQRTLELLANVMNAHDVNIVECSYRCIYKDFIKYESECDGNIYVATASEAIEDNLKWGRFKPVAWNKLYKRDIMKDIYFPAGKYHEDEFTTYKYYYAASKIAFLDFSLYNYNCARLDSITAKFSEKNFDACEAFREKVDKGKSAR